MLTKEHINTFLRPCLGSRILQNRGLPLLLESYNLVLLNSPSLPYELLPSLWALSNLKVCADGGVNRLYNHFNVDEREKYIPDFIAGDLDSAESHVLQHYRSLYIPLFIF
jgi:hypothetical protein